MSRTSPAHTTEWSSLSRSALILSAIAAAVFGLLACRGAGLREFRLGEHARFAEAYTALSWISVVLAPALAWIFLGLAVLVGGIALLTRGSRSVPEFLEFGLEAVPVVVCYALAPIVLLFVGPFVLWLVFWFETGFGSCVPPACESVPAVP